MTNVFDIERIFGYVLSAGIGGLLGAYSYFIKIKGLEDKLETKCDAEKVAAIAEKTFENKMIRMESKIDKLQGVITLIARQAGIDIPD
jgi:hypothetical protein